MFFFSWRIMTWLLSLFYPSLKIVLCACVFRHIQDPASQRLTWNKPPKSVLVIKKIRDASLLQPFKELCIFLTEVGAHTDIDIDKKKLLQRRSLTLYHFVLFQVKDMIVYVEKKVLDDPAISGDENFGAITKKFCTFREGMKTSLSMLWLTHI